MILIDFMMIIYVCIKLTEKIMLGFGGKLRSPPGQSHRLLLQPKLAVSRYHSFFKQL